MRPWRVGHAQPGEGWPGVAGPTLVSTSRWKQQCGVITPTARGLGEGFTPNGIGMSRGQGQLPKSLHPGPHHIGRVGASGHSLCR